MNPRNTIFIAILSNICYLKIYFQRKNQQKGVWFKKQKYHCVYEYPREPESPVAPNTDLWRPLSDFSNFTGTEFNDIFDYG